MSVAVKTLMTAMPHTIGDETSVEKGQQMLTEFKCHHLPVLNGGHLVGIISDRDIELVEAVGNLEEIPVKDIMTDEPVVVDPDSSVKDVVNQMLKTHINSVIVRAKDDQPWGIFTSTDALKYFVETLVD